MSTLTTNQPLINRLETLVKHPQFIWWIGHCCVIVCTSIYFLYWITFSSNKVATLYYWAYRSAILSFSVVIYKLYGVPQWDWDYFRRIQDENFFYLTLASVWYFNPPVFVTLIPYATFSSFHLINYFRSNIIPTFIPAASAVNDGDSASGNVKLLVNLSKRIHSWVLRNYGPAMRTVSYTEVVVITSFLFFHTLTLYINIFTLFVYLAFLRIRYHMNSHTQLVFSQLGTKLDSFFLPPNADPRIPSYVSHAYHHAKALVKYAGQLPQPETNTKDL